MFSTIIIHDFTRPLRERLNARKHVGPYRWTPAKPGGGRGFYSSSGDMLTVDDSSFALRLELAGDHTSSRVTAYWCDDDGFTTLTPIIARLPHGRGFLAGWSMGAGMLGNLDSTIYSDEGDAASAAFSMAESDAERERDYREEHADDDSDDVEELEAAA